jgi:hypothetical protein
MSSKKEAEKHVVLTLQTGAVKHPAYRSIQEAREQNAKNALRYTPEQHALAQTVAQQVQEQFFTKRVYVNARDKFIAVKVENAMPSYKLLLIAKKYGAQVVNTKNNSVILRLFAAA